MELERRNCKHIDLFGNKRVERFLIQDIRNLTRHPITQEPFSDPVTPYIQEHAQCYDLTNDLVLSDGTLREFFKWYDESRKKGFTVSELRNNLETTYAYNIVRYYLSIYDFQSHFRTFDGTDINQERYERYLAEQALSTRGRVGTWLLRHSSYNRPVEQKARDRLKQYGIRYYALSYVTKMYQIEHELIEHRIGFGWRHRKTWFPNFLDCLEEILRRLDLPYDERVSKYVDL